MSKSVFFLSDAHLGAEGKEKEKLKEEKLISFLPPDVRSQVEEETGEGE